MKKINALVYNEKFEQTANVNELNISLKWTKSEVFKMLLKMNTESRKNYIMQEYKVLYMHEIACNIFNPLIQLWICMLKIGT